MKRTLFNLFVLLSVTGMQLRAQNWDAKIAAKADSLLKLMTLEEKVAMCHAQSKFSSPGVPRLGVPEVWMSDGPHGVRPDFNWNDWGYSGQTNDSCTAFPALTCLAATFDPQLAYEYGNALGEEALYREKDMMLGPGVNIYRTPLNGRNFEYMGEDPLLASVLAVPYIKGVQQNGVAACVKHYALNNQEEYRGHINVKLSDRALHEIYLPAFKASVIEGGVWSIMGAYNQYNKQHCCHNDILLNRILKGDWKFDGVVVSDWGGVHDTPQSAKFGLDIEMGTYTNGLTSESTFGFNDYFLADPFLKGIKDGTYPEALVNDKARRILLMILRTSMRPGRGFGSLNTQAHLDVARKVGAAGIVLLKNEGFFPLKDDAKLTIAVIGENATRAMTVGGGSSDLKARDEISPLRGIKARFKNAKIVHAMGYASGGSAYGRVLEPTLNLDSLHKAAVKLARKADIVLFVGGLNKNHNQDCEGGDRLSYGLPFGQEQLLADIVKVNPNTGMVLVSGNAVSMPWLGSVKGLMQAWYLGSQTGPALADVLSGDVNPSGKLPFTFPVKLEDNPAHQAGKMAYPGDSIDVEYPEGILVGYRWHDTKKIKPQFAFGYGLSYTAFELKNVTADKKTYSANETIKVTCQVQNTGAKDGAEVVQLYVGKTKSKVERAVKELKAFDKVMVKAGASATLSLTVNVADLAYYDEAAKGWTVEPGKYNLYVGNASDNIVETIKFEVE